MKVSTVETEKIIKQEQQVTITRSELSDLLKRTAAEVIVKVDAPAEVGMGLVLISSLICANIEKAIFEKEEK